MKYFLNWKVLVIMVVCCIFTLPVPALAGLSAYDIVKKSEDLLNQAKDSKVEMTMTLVNKNGDIVSLTGYRGELHSLYETGLSGFLDRLIAKNKKE